MSVFCRLPIIHTFQTTTPVAGVCSTVVWIGRCSSSSTVVRFALRRQPTNGGLPEKPAGMAFHYLPFYTKAAAQKSGPGISIRALDRVCERALGCRVAGRLNTHAWYTMLGTPCVVPQPFPPLRTVVLLGVRCTVVTGVCCIGDRQRLCVPGCVCV